MSTVLLLLLSGVILLAVFVFHKSLHSAFLPYPAVGNQLRTPLLSGASKASILQSRSGPYTFTKTHPRPQISQRELLIRNHTVGLNPIDWKCVTYGFGVHDLPWISGRECAGTVEEVGSDVKGWRTGERVWLCSTNYRDVRTSTFQEFVVAAPHNVGRLPAWVSFDRGATLGVGSVAAATALFNALAIPWPTVSRQSSISRRDPALPQAGERQWILVWGGSCVTGMMAIQFARLAGFRVFAVAGIHNAPELHDLGVERVADRHAPDDAVAEARALGIKLAIDCVGAETANYCVRTMEPGGKMVCLVKNPQQAILVETQVQATDVLIKRFHEDKAFGQLLVDLVSDALFQGNIRPIRHEVVEGGLGSIERGLKKLMDKKVSGRKLVVQIN